MESDDKMKIEGDGYLISNDLNKQFPVKFKVEQIHTGKISGKCTLSRFKYEDILSPSQLENCRHISSEQTKITLSKMYGYISENFSDSSLKGKTKNRDDVVIKDIFISACSIHFPSMSLDLKFLAGKVEASYETISTKDQLCIEYGIINLDLTRLLQGHVETDIGKITFSKLNGHEKVIEEMKIFKTPLLSGFINITDVNVEQFESFDSYFETLDETICKVLELLSLAQSTYLSNCLIRIYAKIPNSNSYDDYKLKKLIMLGAKTKIPSLGQPLIEDWVDIYKFISTTLPKYTDDLREGFDLYIALEWYLESFSHGVLESDYLLACTSLELLKDRHNKTIDNENVLPEASFEEYLPELKKQINDVLKKKGINNKKRKKISGNLGCINRTSFKISLLKLLKDYNIIHNDLFPDIQKIIDNRNQITHSGKREKDSEELFDDKIKLICLIQRIFFALLGYDGYFLDQNDRYLRKKFIKFTSGGFARSAEEIPRGKNGAR